MVYKVKGFVSSLILFLIIAILSITMTVLLLAPLLSLSMYGFFTQDLDVFISNILTKNSVLETPELVIIIVQSVLSFAFVIVTAIFFKKILNLYLKNENYVKTIYRVFFACILILPTILLLISIFCKVRLTILSCVVAGVFSLLFTAWIIISKKILPNTTDAENRKYLFTEAEYEN